ncbi:MAG TPA: NADP-dependent malic enzyme [Flavobacteriales bacterium]|nr:NADP-dependent malic enzyme [Flavobacteriales bacterium]HRE73434.1 NADP-dependent malic enzyme [Flavobacteriales bacterium]HRJ34337.1 NADP-dependent malic enzyme [Flavobacteriales bacterium]HRJ38883.1 NADP-dependent malic enzyme [Flavobacteriales bacterium]
MTQIKFKKQDALDYHSSGRKGKIEVIPTKPYASQRDLSLAYSPGVAEPCLAINKRKDDVYKYTAKGNLVAVISNGTAVLGLGDIGPEASKPVMEGKGMLFKIYADIDVFDIEIDETDVDAFVKVVKAIAPTFGGINLEDIKAPECFEIERRLKEELDIPIMHDDQHGTAIISGAALLNALELAGKKISKVKIVVNGAGAAAISCAKLYVSLGAKKENILMVDSKGPITKNRKDLDEHKSFFASARKVNSLEEAMEDADVFLGLSKGNILSKEMVKSMAKNPIVFALANPDPEISYKEAKTAREDVIVATGRSDQPNQVNNVLGFPYIFRGALDVRATKINEEMKLAAVRAIAELAKEPVPEEVNEAYGEKNISFGRENIIPKPLDPRLLWTVAPAVAKAAVDSGVAKEPMKDIDAYIEELQKKTGHANKLLRSISEKASKNPKRIVFAEGDNYKILKAAQIASDEGIATPILLGDAKKIRGLIEEYSLDLEDAEIIDPKDASEYERRVKYGELLFKKRQRKGMTLFEAQKAMRERNHFGAMMVEVGEADALISGISRSYKEVIRPSLQIIGTADDVERVAGMYVIFTKDGPVFFADTTVNHSPNAEEIVDITLMVAKAVRNFRITPRIAMLSYSNFGSANGDDPDKMRKAVSILHKEHPNLIVDGEMQANFALNQDLLQEFFPFSDLNGSKPNTFIFPNLASGNIAYKMIQEMTNAEVIGPILLGMRKSFHVLQIGCSVREIVNMVKIAVVDAQTKSKK